MQRIRRPLAFWIVIVALVLSIVVMLIGQATAVFDYDRAVELGLQESRGEVGEFGVQVNRAFGAGDTIVYVPLMLVAVFGLTARKRWSLLTTAAVAGISVYWSVTITFTLLFLRGVPGYEYVPGPGIWSFVLAYAALGVVGLFYLSVRGDRLLD